MADWTYPDRRSYDRDRPTCKTLGKTVAGEKFEDAIYCHLIYHSGEKKRWDFFLLFEKQLICSIIGNVIDSKSKATDMMLSGVAKYAAKQLAECAKHHFLSLEQFEITKEQLLTHEQFRKVYEQQSPRFSLLFDTGRGYFAYCMITSETPRLKEDISSVTKNALTEIERHLLLANSPDENEAHPHPDNPPPETSASQKMKILVVDDSNFMRKTLSDLLGSDYEVLTADSGRSAIRSITLTRPDLVLLDYEMPVCNGSQVLEMIRSEKDFKDIPVIFLTYRADRESVKKALSLKPDGYLSKSLPAESIKREIDHFFEKKCQVL